MFGEVQSGGFDFLAGTQTDDRFDDVRDNYGANDRQHKGDSDRFNLFQPGPVIGHDLRQPVGWGRVGRRGLGDVSVDAGVRQNAGQQRAQRATNGMNTESIQRIVIAKPTFDLVTEKPRNQSGGYANNHRARRIDETASGRDHDQTGDRAGAETQHAGLAFDQPFRQRPHE